MNGQRHLVQFSTGAGSAEVALRVWAAHGPRTVLITADTTVEHADNWRYAREVVALMPGVMWTILRDGRTPMQVGRDERCVPNNRMAVCSRILKRELIRAHLDATYDPTDSVVYLGYDWTEEKRAVAATAPWVPWRVEYPLMSPPHLTKWQIIERHRDDYAIEPIVLYKRGFSHANCGGACVRGGQAQWERLLRTDPSRYAEWESEEETTRAMLDKDVAILRDRRGGLSRPLTLRGFRERLVTQPNLFDGDDEGACGCDPWSPG